MVSTSTATSGASRAISPGGPEPVELGHLQVQHRDVGTLQHDLLDRAPAVGGDPDDLHVRQRPEQRGEPGADHGMVVGQHHPNLAHPAGSGVSGNQALTCPPEGDGPAENAPPSSAARWRIACSPTPGDHGPEVGPVVADRHLEPVVVAQSHHGAVGPGVPGDVGQGLGRDPVRRNLHRGRQGRHLGRHVEADPYGGPVGPPAELIGALLQGADQPQLVQRRRPQVVHDPAYVSERRPAVPAQGVQQLGRPVGVVHHIGGRIGGERDSGQRGTEPVVQLASEPPTLFLASADQLLARGLQLRGHDRGVQSGGQRGRQQAEHLAIRVGEPLFPVAQADRESADRPRRRRSAAP